MNRAVCFRSVWRGVDFYKGEGLTIYKNETDLFPLKLMLNNTSLSWRIERDVWLSVKRLREIITNYSK